MNNLDFQKYESVFDRCQTVNVEFATDVIERSEEQTRLLWPPFWNEGEITVLFAESNVGKSIVAMQVARDIARGRSSISDFEAEPKEVVYFDFELSDKQFRDRYAGCKFPDKLLRGSQKEDMQEFVTLENAMHDILQTIVNGAQVVIIDNITYLSESLDQTAVLRLMKKLKAASRRYGASIMLISHCPKRPQNRILTKNDNAGSMYLINFADSAFAIGRSYLEPELRYLKQIKVRLGEFQFTEKNVLVGEFKRDEENMLSFSPLCAQSEYVHIENV